MFGSLREAETVSMGLLTLFWSKHGPWPRANLSIFIWCFSLPLGNLPPPHPLLQLLPSFAHPHPLPSFLAWSGMRLFQDGRMANSTPQQPPPSPSLRPYLHGSLSGSTAHPQWVQRDTYPQCKHTLSLGCHLVLRHTLDCAGVGLSTHKLSS